MSNYYECDDGFLPTSCTQKDPCILVNDKKPPRKRAVHYMHYFTYL